VALRRQLKLVGEETGALVEGTELEKRAVEHQLSLVSHRLE
jgi:hypothetical protein